jgi:hypothetical protein
MTRYFCALALVICGTLAALIATPAFAQQVYTSRVELTDGTSKTESLVSSKAKLTPPVARGTKVRPCGKRGNLWTYVKLADKCPTQAKPTLPVVSVVTASKLGAVKWADCGKARIEGAYRIIGQGSGATTGTCNGLVATGIQRVGVEIRGDNAVLSNFRLIHAEAANVSPDLPEGVQIKTGNNVLVRNGYVWGNRMVAIPGKYTNGDGYVVESGVHDARFENVESVESSDSSFDWLKGTRITGDNMVGRVSDRCLKVGAVDAHIGHLTCSGMRYEAIAAYAPTSTPVIDWFTYDFTGQTKAIKLFVLGNAQATLEVRHCEFIGTPPVGTKISASKSDRLKLDASCVLPQG